MNYQTNISFGLVNIPVLLNSAIKDNNVTFNLLHKKCDTRLEFIRYCPHCKEKVKQNEIVKGYEYNDNSYITFTNEEFNKLKSDNDKSIEIIAFVDINEIDPVYYDKSYILNANKSTKAFELFKEALRKSRKVAIAKTYLHNRLYYVVIRFGYKNIILNTLYYEEEIKLQEEKTKKNYTDDELKMAIKLIDSLTDNFKPEEYKDEYQNRIKDAINKKMHGEKITKVKGKKQKSIDDLYKALEASLKGSNAKK